MSEKSNDFLIRDAHESAIWPIGLGPRRSDARLVASSGNPEAPGLALWDAYSGALKWRNPFDAGIFAMSLASTAPGISMAVATEEGISLFEFPAAEVGGTESDPGRKIEVSGAPIWNVAAGILSGGASFFAGAAHDGTVYRWTAGAGSPLGAPLVGHSISVKGIDVVEKDSNSIIVSGDEQGVVLRWDADTGESIGDPLRTGGERISAGATPESAHFFASADYEGNVRVWDALSGLQVGRSISAGGYPTGLALWDVSGSLNVATANDGDAVVYRWDVETGQRISELAPGYSVAAGQLKCGTATLAIGTVDGSIRVMRMY